LFGNDIFAIGAKGGEMKVALILGSDSDLPVARKAFDILKSFGVGYEAHIMSAHRTPERAAEFSGSARENGFGVIIAFAGMAAHLAGVIAAHTTLPVIGVPCKGGALDGLDALLSTVQMPSGVPVATVALDGGANAALLAVRILALGNRELAGALDNYREKMRRDVEEKDAKLRGAYDQAGTVV
jgi:5-(carboxyamino)imidazole ribonucleotide mutase